MVLCITILYFSCIFVAFALCLHYNCIVAVSRLVAYKKNDSPCLEAIMGPQLTYYRLNVSFYNACMRRKLHAIDLLCSLDVISITAYFFKLQTKQWTMQVLNYQVVQGRPKKIQIGQRYSLTSKLIKVPHSLLSSLVT